jgi:sec-independent protein translocase protein TatA
MGIGMRELIVILLVVLVVFGTKKLTSIGTDLGNAVRGFKKAVSDGEDENSSGSGTSTPPRQIRSDGTDAEFPESKTAQTTTSQKSDRPA